LSEPSLNPPVRLLGGGGLTPEKGMFPFASRLQPQASAAPNPFPQPAEAGDPAPVFLADASQGADLLDVDGALAPLARLCLTARVETPFLIGLVGPAGGGKSFALNRLRQMTQAAANSGQAGFLQRVVAVAVAAAAESDPAVAFASAAFAGLSQASDGQDYSGLVDETAYAGGDPHSAAKAAADRHDELVKRLDAERAARDEVEARRARLSDALLYETPGSRVDTLARTSRASIETKLRRFDLAGADPSVSYRDLVRDLASAGPGSRVGLALRSLWMAASQRRLIGVAIVAFIVAFALNLLRDGAVAAWLRGLSASAEPVAAWVAAHGAAMGIAIEAFVVLGCLAILLNLWRGLAFYALLSRGLRFLSLDTAERRRDLDASSARLNQRVATLSAEAEGAAKRAETLARRVGVKPVSRGPGPAFLQALDGPRASAKAFLAELGRRIGGASAPDRLVFTLDNLDALKPEAALAWIESAHALLSPGCIAIVAIDPARLIAACGGAAAARERFDKWLQLSFALPDERARDGARLVARLIANSGETRPAGLPDETASGAGEPLSADEASMLATLGALAAGSPRSAKRFLNAYRIARMSKIPRPAIALMLALAMSDDEAAKRGLEAILASPAADFGDPDEPPSLIQAVRSARAANNGAISRDDARAAWALARRYAPAWWGAA
jgi:hypothetical protein